MQKIKIFIIPFMFFIGITLFFSMTSSQNQLYIIDSVNNRVYWNNARGEISIYPITINKLEDYSYINITSNVAANLDIAIALQTNKMQIKQLDLWNGTDWNKVTNVFDRTTYNGMDIYYRTNIPFSAFETKQARFLIKTEINSTGKYDVFVKPSSMTLFNAISSNNYIWLDPWWDSSFQYCQNITTSPPNLNTLNNLVIQFNFSDSSLQADGDDIRILDKPCEQGGNQIAHELREKDTINKNFEIVFYDNFTGGNSNIRSIYYGSSTAVNAESDLIDYYTFDSTHPFTLEGGTGWQVLGGVFETTADVNATTTAYMPTTFFNGSIFIDFGNFPDNSNNQFEIAVGSQLGSRDIGSGIGSMATDGYVFEAQSQVGVNGMEIDYTYKLVDSAQRLNIGLDQNKYWGSNTNLTATLRESGLGSVLTLYTNQSYGGRLTTTNGTFNNGGYFSLWTGVSNVEIDNLTLYKNGYRRIFDGFATVSLGNPVENTPPYTTIELSNETIIEPNQQVLYNTTWADNLELSYCQLSVNETGIFANKSLKAFATTNNSACDYTYTWTNLTPNIYAARIYANDSGNLWGVTQDFYVTIQNTPPYYNTTTLTINETIIEPNQPFNLNTTWFDDVGLSGYVLEHNETGIPSNDSWSAFNFINNSASDIEKIFTTTTLDTYALRIYANDTANNWNVTDYKYIVLTSFPPELNISTYKINDSTIAPNYKLLVNGTWSDNLGLSGYYIEDNETGNFLNRSFDLFQFKNNSYSNKTITYTNTTKNTYALRVYANDTNNYWSVSDYLYFTIDNIPIINDILWNTTLANNSTSIEYTDGLVINNSRLSISEVDGDVINANISVIYPNGTVLLNNVSATDIGSNLYENPTNFGLLTLDNYTFRGYISDGTWFVSGEENLTVTDTTNPTITGAALGQSCYQAGDIIDLSFTQSDNFNVLQSYCNFTLPNNTVIKVTNTNGDGSRTCNLDGGLTSTVSTDYSYLIFIKDTKENNSTSTSSFTVESAGTCDVVTPTSGGGGGGGGGGTITIIDTSTELGLARQHLFAPSSFRTYIPSISSLWEDSRVYEISFKYTPIDGDSKISCVPQGNITSKIFDGISENSQIATVEKGKTYEFAWNIDIEPFVDIDDYNGAFNCTMNANTLVNETKLIPIDLRIISLSRTVDFNPVEIPPFLHKPLKFILRTQRLEDGTVQALGVKIYNAITIVLIIVSYAVYSTSSKKPKVKTIFKDIFPKA